MLNYQILANSIIDRLYNKKTDHQLIITKEINKFVIINMQVMGNYVGMLPAALGSDPLSGPLEFKTTCKIDQELLQIKSSQGFQQWYNEILNQIKMTSYIMISFNGVFLSSPIKVFSNIIPSQFQRPNQFQKAWEIISKYIVKDLKNAIINNIPTKANSISGGTGIMTLTTIQ